MTDKEDPATPLLRLFHAQTKVKSAKHDLARAGLSVDLAQIMERQAELVSQADPLRERIDPVTDAYGHGYDETRKLINDAIFYVIVGRWPK